MATISKSSGLVTLINVFTVEPAKQQQLDRVIGRLRFTGHFTGTFGNAAAARQGDGRAIDFTATDIYRIANGRIAENWHLEDNLTLLQQLGAVSQ